ncbi:rhodanese-like domain-containing protein [Aspergillus aculeatinus CBS 121060]|uniref:Rhodanese-like protein n=1 Tax=Aspergillus aculeatinus CBS 121060 TaxID=1448322 RepID=A0ACD1HIT9_9EURO|nr:Rhodanese-like protein [Aspergillus aculeatinus CBS 121060]RAH73431.1 Rhodanese-like protein [Aspergillus aculeatinus CBS 121060]
MSSLLPIQRRSATLLTRAIKQTPNARRSILTSATRQLPTRPCSSSILRLVPQSHPQFELQPQPQTQQQQHQRRSNSTNATADKGFKQWDFEEITTSLPSANPSSPQKPLILIDVREPAELNATGIIPTAVNVPLASQPDALFLTPDEFETRFGFPKPGVEEGSLAVTDTAGAAAPEIVFYCKAGVRARAAAQLAVQAGYDAARIGVYEGSWLDWADRGGKVERWEGDD